jgi:hypothetical protein
MHIIYKLLINKSLMEQFDIMMISYLAPSIWNHIVDDINK